MDKAFEKSQWIWIDGQSCPDTYGEFCDKFSYSGGKAVFRISCDGDYTLLVNGKYATGGQYGDYEHYKIYDSIDIAPYLTVGENEVSILVWYFGENTQRYIKADAGVIFELLTDVGTALVSGAHTPARKSSAYRSGYRKLITRQLGFSFLYDANKENGGEFAPATVVKKNCDLYPLPIKKMELLPKKDIRILKNEGNYYLVDLGEETVGHPTLELVSEDTQLITVAWGEDLDGQHVRRLIGGRDFSFEYITRVGTNAYTNYMLRISGRYLEIYSEKPIKLNYLGVIPVFYPVTELPLTAKTELDRQILDRCVRTLRLCMMEHYVDTPWREQCLYVLDSRNQMLCGYRAFLDGNAEYAKANLRLIGKDKREDGLLSICYPCGMDLTIPSFSLYYFMQVREYLDFTGDLLFVEEIYPKLLSIIEVFVKKVKGGLLTTFEGTNHWNFYEWIPSLEGRLFESEEPRADLVINSLFVLALQNLKVIAERIGKEFPYNDLIAEVKANADTAFYSEKDKAYTLYEGSGDLTVLGNALAILSGIARDSKALAEVILSGRLSDCTLSMKCFKYDALLLADRERWYPAVVAEIHRDYLPMIEAGSTTVWETADGAKDFDNAGSLCHGWSAVPICYL